MTDEAQLESPQAEAAEPADGVDDPHEAEPVQNGLAPVRSLRELIDRYGRNLRYLYTETGQSIDETLIREGLAAAWARDGQHRDHLVKVECGSRVCDVECLR